MRYQEPQLAATKINKEGSMRNFLIKLLGGIPQKELSDEMESMIQYRNQFYISCDRLDYASTLLKRWNEYRESINTLAKEILKNNPDYFKNNASLFFDLVLQDYYFRRLFLLQNRKDFFEDAEENITNFHCRGKEYYVKHFGK